MADNPLYQRVLLKISGEGLTGSQEFGLETGAMERIAGEIKGVLDQGIELCLVIGGGNIFRGIAGVASGLERSSADHMGMLATVINALGMQSVLEGLGVATRVMSAIPMQNVCEPYIRRRAIRHLEKGRVVIFAAGTGSPYFTTDTTAALRASEISADAILKATKVDGVYTADPATHPDAKRYETLTYQEALEKRLKIMDASAFALCMDNGIPIIVCNFNDAANLQRIVGGDTSAGTLITG